VGFSFTHPRPEGYLSRSQRSERFWPFGTACLSAGCERPPSVRRWSVIAATESWSSGGPAQSSPTAIALACFSD